MARRIRGLELHLKIRVSHCCKRWTVFFGGTAAKLQTYPELLEGAACEGSGKFGPK